MKSKRYIYYCIALLAGCLLTACVDEVLLSDREPETGIEGKGALSIAFSADRQVRTKADPGNGGDPNSGIDYEDTENAYLHFIEEDSIRHIRIILYDMEGKAKYIKDYDVTVANQWVKNQYPDYQTKAFQVDLQPYQVAVLVNYKNAWTYFATDRNNAATNLAERTKDVGHEVTLLTDTPLDFSEASGDDYYKAKTFLMQTLTGVYDTPAWYIDQSLWRKDACFFMSNADGLVEVKTEQINTVTAEAEKEPIAVRVERAIAKVAFFIADDLLDEDEGNMPANILPTGIMHDKLTGSWRVDTQNTKVYPLRKQTNILGGTAETPTSSQINRYAEDPNFAEAVVTDFFRIPSVGDDPIYDENLPNEQTAYLGNPLVLANKELQKSGYIDPKNLPGNYAYLEYVAENTLAYGEATTETVTHILLRLELCYMFAAAEDDEDPLYASDYCTYKGNVYLKDWMVEWLEGRIPDLSDYADITAPDLTGVTPEQKTAMLALLTADTAVAGEAEGLRYYVGGVNYYRIPIRHFSDTQLGENGTYGKYGVVRNNTYVVTLESITSLGRPTLSSTHLTTKAGVTPGALMNDEGIRVHTTMY